MKVSNLYKAEKGLIRIHADVEDGRIRDIRITGDFFMTPEEAIASLEGMLKGRRFEAEDVGEAIEKFYATGAITPMISKEDFAKAVMGAKDEGPIA